MKHKRFFFCSIAGLIFIWNPWVWASEITSIDFKGTENPSEITIQADENLVYEKQENQQDKQVVLEFKGVSISKSNARPIDTSSFNSRVNLISPYQVDGQANVVRVVIQLRDFVSPQIKQDGNTLHVQFPVGLPPEGSGTPAAANSDATKTEPQASGSPAPSNQLDEFVNNQNSQNFTGKPISLQLRDADLIDAFRLIGEASGFNIVLGDDVKGKITISLSEVPWDQALDVVLHSAHLGAERSNNVLRVASLSSLTQEKIDEMNAKNAAKANTSQVTKIFSINYANLSDLQGILSKFSSQAASGQSTVVGSGALGLKSALVQVDNRTNSLIVRDYPDSIDKMKKLVEMLDTQTPEVLVEAKIVEATESFANDINGGFGIGGNGASPFYASVNGSNPLDPLISGTTTGSSISTLSGTSPLNGAFGFSPDVSFIPGVSQLNALLKLAESESQVKVVTAPKTVVLNKQKASIVESIPVLVPQATTIAPGGTVTSGSAVQQANISLTVTPTVTNDGSVQLDLSVQRDVPESVGNNQNGIGTRMMSTLVLVESGTTLVIGGVYTLTTQHVDEGIPFLRKIPIIGALFGHTNDTISRSELFIFITPKIINMKEAGVGA